MQVGDQNISFGYVTAGICANTPGQCGGSPNTYGDNGYSYSWASDVPSVIGVAGHQLLGGSDHVTVNALGVGSANVTATVEDNVCPFGKPA